MESYLTRSSISRELNAEQKRVLQGINLSVARIFYGSIDVETIIENLDSIVGTLGVSVDVLTTMLILNSPDALNAALYTPGAEWTVAIPDVNIPNPSPLQTPSPSPSPMPVTAGGPRESLAQIYDSTRFWRLLNALWVLPILVSLIVLVLTYQEMNRIIALRDTDRSKVLSDEISTASARSDRFFEQQALLLQRHETFFKEATETIKVVLSDEIKRVAARSDNFDKQQAALLERYENLSKESSDIVRIRLQNAGGCYKPRRCSPVSSKLVVKDPALRTGH